MIILEQDLRYHSKATYFFGGKKYSIQAGIEIEPAEEMLSFILYWKDLYLIHKAE